MAVKHQCKVKYSTWRHHIHGYYSKVSGERDPETITINLWLYNEGDRTARDATIFLWLPWPEWRVPGWNGILNPETYFKDQGFRTIANVPLDGRRYWHVAFDVPFPTYPGVERLAHTFQVVVPIGFKGDVLWRVGYDDGIEPPQSNPEGRLNFNVFTDGEDNPESQI